MPDHLHALPAGYKLNEYRLERILGSGGFGITYYAWDENLNKPVAIKEYLPSDFAVRADGTSVRPKSDGDAGDYQWGLERFLDEARALARFDHPHLNQVYRFFEDNGTAYLVLDYIEGETLAQMLSREGRLSEAPLRRLLGELLSGLEEVHSAGYVHRDVKPGNIMFRADGSAVLLDFGAARQVIGAKLKSVTAIHTPGYAPVEQYDQKADDVGAWSDIYALGMVAYRCVSGIGESGLIDAVTRSRLERKGELEKDMKPAVVVGKGRYAEALLAAIDWAIKIDETGRPQSVAAMRSAIDSAKAVGASEAAAGRVRETVEAVKRYRKAAEEGDAAAQCNLGDGYYYGKGVTQDYAQALKWFRKAADQGDADAQYSLGFMYHHAKGVTQDYAEAVKWYREAADQGDADAQYSLGFMYHHAKGVTQDYAQALKWFRKAADQGDAGAQYGLGFMYHHAKGVTQDYAEAVKWYREAADQGHALAQKCLGDMYRDGKGVTQDYAEAVKWYRKAADQGGANFQAELGWVYYYGNGVTRDYAEAVKWIRKAAEQGHATAQDNLGNMYRNGEGVVRNYAEALKWYRKAADQGDEYAQYNLGLMYQNGKGVTQSKSEARKWYEKTAAQGYGPAKKALEDL